jgi:TolB-like protein
MLITDLANVGSLQIVEREKLNEVLGELKLSKSKFIDPRTAQKLGKGLAAEYIMTGSYAVAGDDLRVDVRVVEVQTGRVAASEKVEGKKADFFAVEKDLVDLLIKTLDVKLSTGERGKLRANATQSFAAWQKYSAGLDASDRGDGETAQRLFQEALEADPSYQAAKSASERLNVIFRRSDAARSSEVDRLRRSLDPKAPDFGPKVDDLFSKLDSQDPAQFKQKVALLTWLAENDLAPSLVPQFSRVQLEVASILGQFDDAPDARELSAPVCEYLVSRFPENEMAEKQCRQQMKMVGIYEKTMALDERKKRWADKWKDATEGMAVGLRESQPEIRRLFKIYAAKVKRK